MDLGDYMYGAKVYVPFNTYGSNGESIIISDFVVTDIEIYKNGGTTQRTSDVGVTLLDTDGINFDGVVGVHGFSIDTADNTVAGFYAPANHYMVIVTAITVNTQTVNFVRWFSIENRPQAGLILRTTIATLATQIAFTITSGPVDNGALVNTIVLVQDAASVVQKAHSAVSGYVGSTKGVTLGFDPAIFTMAVGDHISFWLPSSITYMDDFAISQVQSQSLNLGEVVGALGIIPRNTDLPGFTFRMHDSAGNLLSGLAVNAKRRLGVGALLPFANPVTELSGGDYYIDWDASDNDAPWVMIEFSAAGAVTLCQTFRTQGDG